MNDTIDLEYTATTKPLPPAIPFREIRLLAGSVDNLTFHGSRAARIVLDWLDVVAPVQPAAKEDADEK